MFHVLQLVAVTVQPAHDAIVRQMQEERDNGVCLVLRLSLFTDTAQQAMAQMAQALHRANRVYPVFRCGVQLTYSSLQPGKLGELSCCPWRMVLR